MKRLIEPEPIMPSWDVLAMMELFSRFVIIFGIPQLKVIR